MDEIRKRTEERYLEVLMLMPAVKSKIADLARHLLLTKDEKDENLTRSKIESLLIKLSKLRGEFNTLRSNY